MEPLEYEERDTFDNLITDVGGCGCYQLTLTLLIGWLKVMSTFSIMFMAYGNYNPGWTCVDQGILSTTQSSNDLNINDGTYHHYNRPSYTIDASSIIGFNSTTTKATSGTIFTTTPITATHDFNATTINANTITNTYAGNITTSNTNNSNINNNDENNNNCQLFSKCSNIKYNSGMSTIVTEWNLSCDRAWISSLIISIQMAGIAIGSYIAGYLGDRFGRKSTVYIIAILNMISNFATIFCSSWQMFTIARFFIGATSAGILNLPIVLAVEFVPYKWRNVLIVFPFWPIGCFLFALCAMLTEDWQYIHVLTGIGVFLGLLPAFWVPESIRWLVVKGRTNRAVKIVRSISFINRREVETADRIESIGMVYKTQISSDDHSIRNLLKPGYRKITIIVGFCFISYSIIYFAISFGIKALPGNLYTNMLIMYSCEIALTAVSAILPNIIGRKPFCIIFLIITTVSLFTFVIIDRTTAGSTRTIVTLVCALVSRVVVDAAWDVSITFTIELYPTVIRSTTYAYISVAARIGGIIAPYLIPNEPEAYYINYLIMALLALTCSAFFFLLKENKDSSLPDTWIISERGNDKKEEHNLEQL